MRGIDIAQTLCTFLLGIGSVIFVSQSGSDRDWLSMFSTKTAYRHCSLKSFVDLAHDKLNDGTCHLVHVNALFRHGTRAPKSAHPSQFQNLYERLISNPKAHLPSGFRGHPIPFINATEKDLLPRGYKELYDLGRLFRQLATRSKFEFTQSNSRFYASSTRRTMESGRSFYSGLIGPSTMTHSPVAYGDCAPERSVGACPVTSSGIANFDHIRVDDPLLRFFDYCKRYNAEVEHNKSSALEYTKFRHGPEMRQAMKGVIKRHNLNAQDFFTGDLYTIFLACAYETGASMDDTEPPSPWCGLLQESDLRIAEYMVDLKQYWRKSYGYELNYQQSCPLLGEMIQQLQQAAQHYRKGNYNPSNPNLHRGSFWFGHAETLLPVVAALGLFNDSVGSTRPFKLLAKDFPKWLNKLAVNPPLPNMFRASHVAPFAGNLALSLYYCPSLGDAHQSDDPLSGFFVEPRVNDRTVAWPLASPIQPPTSQSPGATVASLRTVLNYFQGCMPGVYDDDKVCSLDSHSRGD